jgi:Ca-activated chloride channel family protein
VSDGHVNQGMRDVDEFASVTAKAYTDRIVTSTLGYGQGYDETLLAAIARSGSGNHVFADNPDSAGAAIAAEVDGLLEKVAQAVSLTVKFEPTVEMIRLYNDLPAQQIGDGQVMIELGDLYADEQRKLLIKFNVPALRELGLARIATLELQYVEVPGLLDHLVSTPVTVNVVPGDEAAQRIPHPTVQSEVLFQEAQDAKKKASEAFETGDLASGRDFLDRADEQLRIAIDIAPEDVRASIDDERRQVQDMKGMSLETGASYMSKLTRDSYHRQNRKRGRRPRPTGPGSTDTSGS